MTGASLLRSWCARCAARATEPGQEPLARPPQGQGKFWNLSVLSEFSSAGPRLALSERVSLLPSWEPERAGGRRGCVCVCLGVVWPHTLQSPTRRRLADTPKNTHTFINQDTCKNAHPHTRLSDAKIMARYEASSVWNVCSPVCEPSLNYVGGGKEKLLVISISSPIFTSTGTMSNRRQRR